MPVDLKNILQIEIPLQVLLAQKNMSVDEILDLAPGSVIQFNKNYESPLHLLANGRYIGLGEAVKVNEKFGLQVKEMSSREDQINAMKHND